jgi:hypothetical protein
MKELEARIKLLEEQYEAMVGMREEKIESVKDIQ